jgi:hypothetical protein
MGLILLAILIAPLPLMLAMAAKGLLTTREFAAIAHRQTIRPPALPRTTRV